MERDNGHTISNNMTRWFFSDFNLNSQLPHTYPLFFRS